MTILSLRCNLRAGGYSPIPVNGKRPPMRLWQQLEGASDADIEGWERSFPYAASTGILTRFVPTLDIDITSEPAAESVEALVRERFEEHGYLLVRVGRAPKRAVLFRCDEPFRKITAELISPTGGSGQKLEFLGDGQQLVAFGLHKETKQPYRWHGGQPGKIQRADLPYIHAEQARRLVNDAADLLCRDFGYKRASERPRKQGNGADEGSADWGHLSEAIRKGQALHDNLRDLAAKLVTSGMGTGAAVNFLRGLMDSAGCEHDARWKARRDDIPRLVESASEPPKQEARSREPPDATNQRFKLLPFDTITLPTAPNYLVKGMVPREGLVVLWGPPKCGKSFLTFDLTMHIALGRQYRGRKVRQGAVVYLALEGGGGFFARVEAWRQKKLGSHSGAVPFYLLTVPVDLIADHVQLIAAVGAQVDAPACVVIDTLNRSLTGSENDPEDMAKYIAAADRIRAAFRCSVLVVHHCGIAGSRPRGHTSLAGADDAQIAIERDEDTGIITATVEHMKDGEAGAVMRSRLQSISLGNDDDGDPITSCVIEPVEGETSAEKPNVTGNNYLALEALRRAVIDAGQQPPASNHIPQQPDIKVCPVETWRGYFYQLKTGQPDTKRKAFVRSLEGLQEAGIIGVWNDLAWVTGHAGHTRTSA